MANQHLADIKRFLANSSLHATPEWVEGCVEFFVAEHENQGYTYNDLKEFVHMQWKLADLREMGQGCLPPNISNIVKTMLPGKYAVQVEWIKNIAQSAYSQLQNMRKQYNENTEVGEKLPQAWEPKPTRMLQLYLCDGHQTIKGIEYRPIAVLNEELIPGFKLLIVGPVECRRGIVLLQQHNLQIIGGEIDSLIVPNAVENILARTLNLETNPDPYKTQSEHTLTQISDQPAETRNVELPSDGNLQNHNDAVPHRRQNTNQGSHRNIEEEFFQEDDLMIGTEMGAHLSLLEHQFQEELQNVNINEAETDVDAMERRYLGEIQSMGFEEIEFEPFNHEPGSTNLQLQASERILKENNDTSQFLNDDDDDLLCQMKFDDLEKTSNEFTNSKSSAIGSKLSSKQNCRQSQIKSIPVGQSSKTITLKAKHVIPQAQNTNKQSKITSFLNKSSECCDSGIGAASTSKSRYERSDLGMSAKVGARETEIPSGFVTELTDGPHDGFVTNRHNEIKFSSNNEQSVGIDKHVKFDTMIITAPEPFVYLSQIKLPVECRKVHTVKAFVLTLLSQLTFGKDGWQLRVTLCDGSSNLDVMLSSDVLEKLIGFSAAEMRAIRQDVPKNPLLKDKLKNILQNAQQRLINLNCLLSIEFLPGPEMPSVIDIEEVAECHLQALETRLDYAYAHLCN